MNTDAWPLPVAVADLTLLLKALLVLAGPIAPVVAIRFSRGLASAGRLTDTGCAAALAVLLMACSAAGVTGVGAALSGSDDWSVRALAGLLAVTAGGATAAAVAAVRGSRWRLLLGLAGIVPPFLVLCVIELTSLHASLTADNESDAASSTVAAFCLIAWPWIPAGVVAAVRYWGRPLGDSPFSRERTVLSTCAAMAVLGWAGVTGLLNGFSIGMAEDDESTDMVDHRAHMTFLADMSAGLIIAALVWLIPICVSLAPRRDPDGRRSWDVLAKVTTATGPILFAVVNDIARNALVN